MQEHSENNPNLSRSVAMFDIETRNLPGGSVQTVNARDLHQYLEVGKDFSTWIKDRIRQYCFIEGADFISENTAPQNGGVGNRGAKVEYHVSLDMAKELAMVERNERGRQARRYFIDCERRLNANPANYLAQMESQMIKMIDDRVDQTVALKLSSNARVAALAYVSVKQLLEEHGAIQKGRHGINRKVGCRMRSAATLRGIVLLKCPHSGVWLFPRDFAAQYMRDEGRALVADHNARQTGQAVMQFGPRRKGRKAGFSVVGKSDSDGKGAPA